MQTKAVGGVGRIAVVGSGVGGLAAAHELRNDAEVTLFEAGPYFGGHAHTVDVTLDGVTHGVDTGFLVLNERTYPRLLALFAGLKVDVAPSEMTFSVQVPKAKGVLEWGGEGVASLFCQPSNALRPGFWRMLRDLVRFNKLGTQLAAAEARMPPEVTLGAFLESHGFSAEFRDWYLLPMLGCIWSCPTDCMLDFPAITMLQFCDNHGLLQIAGRPQWFTVRGGSRRYVDKIVAQVAHARKSTPVLSVRRESDHVTVLTPQGVEHFDALVMATHPDQALRLLSDPLGAERDVLGAFHYQPNRAVLHTDVSVLPSHRQAWSAWNYESGGEGSREVCLHYLINRLQPLPWKQPVIVSMNPIRPVDPAKIVGEYAYDHPVFDAAAVRAQARLHQVQGRARTWYAGAWTGYGFHEDGLKSGQDAARKLLVAMRIGQAEGALA